MMIKETSRNFHLYACRIAKLEIFLYIAHKKREGIGLTFTYCVPSVHDWIKLMMHFWQDKLLAINNGTSLLIHHDQSVFND